MRQTVTTKEKASTSIVVVQQAQGVYFSREPHEYTVDYPAAYAIGHVVPEQGVPIIDRDAEAWIKFQSLLFRWRTQRGAMSSVTEGAACPAYQSIIGMGEVAIPFILAELESEGNEPDQWFWALKAITNDDPVSDEDRGDFVAMAKAWLQWAKRLGHAW